VAGEETGPLITNDAALLDRVRAGDDAAFGLLRQRHADAASRLARDLVVSPAEVDELVAETFARVHAALQRAEGPTDAFRCYLLGALRQVHDRRYARRRPSRRRRHAPEPLDRAALDRAEVTGPGSPLIVRAYFSLPQRWSALLWHTEIEQESEDEVAPLFGLSLSGLAALERRAKEGIRQSYLDGYVAQLTRPGCRPVAERLGAYLRFALSEPRSAEVAVHLTECDQCRAAYGELIDLGASLRQFVAPAVLGSVAASYLSGSGRAGSGPSGFEPGAATGPVTGAPLRPAAQSAETAASTTAAVAASDLAGEPDVRTGPPALAPGLPQHWRWAAAAAGILAAVAGMVVAITLTGHPAALASHDPRPHAGATSLVVGSAQQTKKPAARKARTKAARPAKSGADRTSTSAPPAAPAATPSASPTAGSAASDVTMTASVSVFGPGRGNVAQVFFQVADTGSAGTGSLTATIGLPSGSSLADFGHGHRWTCQQTSSGATCQHDPISAGQQADGLIWIQLSGSGACGQDVQLTVSSGSVSASAQSQAIQCQSGGAGSFGASQRQTLPG
jgi:DNA-directed RNA polymerase specialized sigma24 family protein